MLPAAFSRPQAVPDLERNGKRPPSGCL